MNREIVCSGFGGQGVLTVGKILMYAAYKNGYKVTWFPTYGDEVRGGVANCNVVISDTKVLSPYADNPDILIAMNEGALDRYEAILPAGASCFLNSSLIPADRKIRSNINIFRLPATGLAQEMGDVRMANIVMLGYFIKESELFESKAFEDYMCEYFESEGKGKHNIKNRQAYRRGINEGV